ncbi:MAG: c-type cytochrome [Gemmatimonadota bacterium]|nr:MAG: c-type cytochrome [Gemmatimonadota bacterium]
MFSRDRCSLDLKEVDAVDSSRFRTLALAFVALTLVATAACDDEETTGVPEDPPEFTNADGINGGTMYDKFWTPETGWNQSDPNLQTFSDFADFFRCKQCHAWDRLGTAASYIGRAPRTTRPNVSSLDLKQATAGMTPQELFDALWSPTADRRLVTADLSTYDPVSNPTVGDQMPDLSDIMTEAQVWDLVKFLKEEANDTDLLYDYTTTGTYPTGSITYSNIGAGGNATNGDEIYADNCAACHGADGRAFLVDGEFTIGSFLRAKPYEVQHKVKFGQPGTAMGSLVTDINNILDLYAALTNETNYPDPAFEASDGINGGTMYDKFWTPETGWNQNDPNLQTFNDFPNFFRCKQCHAWDRLGNAASYIGRAPSTTRPNVASLNLKAATEAMSEQELFDALWTSTGRRSVTADLSTYDPATNSTVGDQMPDLSEIMTEEQVWDLVKFLKEEAIDTDLLYDYTTTGTYPTGSITYSNIGAGGNAASGDAIYAANCAACHGADGTGIVVDGSFSVGSFLRAKPYEVQHKVKFGQPGTAMGSLVTDVSDVLDLYAALTNESNYPNPNFGAADGINGGTMYDKFWTPETGWDQSDPNLATFNNFSNFFRCKQCHAWDRLGNAASYIGRAPSTTRPNVASLDLKAATEAMSQQELFDALWTSTGRRSVSADLSTYDPATNSTVGDQMPDLSEIMTEEQVWDLVRFLKEEAIDTDLLYDYTTTGTYPTGSITYSNIGAGGNVSNGDAIYAANCAVCHGADGTAFLVDGSFTVGSFLRAKPYEVQHKVKFGQPGTAMGSLVTDVNDILDLYLALFNAINYPDPGP